MVVVRVAFSPPSDVGTSVMSQLSNTTSNPSSVEREPAFVRHPNDPKTSMKPFGRRWSGKNLGSQTSEALAKVLAAGVDLFFAMSSVFSSNPVIT